jgi:vacuolar-type H+-ATPase subunit F/Vma7
MAQPAFIGDELSAAGFRLAGAQTLLPGPGEELAVFHHALSQHPLVIVTAQVAARLPSAVLTSALLTSHPLVVVIPDVRGQIPVADLAGLVRQELGIEES